MKHAVIVALLFSSLSMGACSSPPPPSPGNNHATQVSSLDELLAPDTIGATVAYVESRIGPAWKVDGDDRIYKIDGCHVAMHASSGNVAALIMDVSDECTTNLKNLADADDSTPIHQMTLGQIEKILGHGEFTADCLTLCGNAYEPMLHQNWDGYSANNNVDFRVSFNQFDDDGEYTATNTWQEAMQDKEGEDYIAQAGFNCDRTYDDLARTLFKDFRINQIAIGSLDRVQDCSAR